MSDTNFTLDEKIKFLESHNFKVRHQSVVITESAYHNKVEENVRSVYQVYKDTGEEIKFNWDRSHKEDQVNQIFSELLRTKLLMSLTPKKEEKKTLPAVALAFHRWLIKNGWEEHSDGGYWYRSKRRGQWPPDESADDNELLTKFFG